MNKATSRDRISAELFKILEDDPDKCSTQYVSKIGKLSSGHRTRKGQFSFHFNPPKRAMPKNVQTTEQWCSFHMLVRLCSKSIETGFSRTWTKKFQMCKLGFKETEESEIKLPTFLCHGESKGIPEKHLFLLHWLCKSHWLWITTNYGNLKRDGSSRPPYLSPDKPVYRTRSKGWTRHGKIVVQNWERSMTRQYTVTLLI